MERKEAPVARPTLSMKELSNEASLFMTADATRDVVAWIELYKMILDVPGSLIEFGVRYGKNLALWSNLRATFEPWNLARRVIGFDTFDGLLGSDEQFDGPDPRARDGTHSVPEGWFEELDRILGQAPHQLVPGDIRETLGHWIKEGQPKAALVHLDLDVYEPTKYVLERLGDIMVDGGLIVVDEYDCDPYPGPGKALRHAEKTRADITMLEWKRLPFMKYAAYARW